MVRVLVVDDDPDIRMMVTMCLEAYGFETRGAADGEEGLRVIRDEDFDAVVLDVMMPVLDGWGVLMALADEPEPPPVVMLSAHCSRADRARAFGLGAVAFVDKPFEPDVLADVVESVASASPDELAARRSGALEQLTADERP